MGRESAGVKMSREYELTIDWAALSKALVKVGVAGFSAGFGASSGIAGTLAALSGTIDAIKEKDSVGEKAWSLFILSFAWSMDQLRQDTGIDGPALRQAFDAAIATAKSKVDETSQVVPTSFLNRPTTLPLYRLLRDELAERRHVITPNTKEEAGSFANRFDAAFDRAVHEVWSRRPSLFQDLAAALAAPGAAATDNRLEWEAYKSALIHNFEVSPIFGQEDRKVSLSQLYIPLRAISRSGGSTPDSQQDEGPPLSLQITALDRELEEWIKGEDGDDIRMIGGGPGSGKSTALKALARRLAEHGDVRPLLVPLQHIDISGDLREAVNKYFLSRSDGHFTHPPLGRPSAEDGPPLVVIFDGLDELARPGVGADELANMFVSKLTFLISTIKGERSRKLRVILSGRMASFQAVGKYLGIPSSAKLEVYGFSPIDDYHESTVDDPYGLAGVDQRPLWWERYANLMGLPTDTPRALIDRRLTDITREPLLCYLLVLSGLMARDWEAVAENPNRIFEKLINDIWERSWGEGPVGVKRQGPGKGLSRLDFNRLMETIALAAWLGGDTRVCSEKGFHDAVEITQCQEPWDNFQKGGGADVANLAMNFYLKGSESQKGFEFTHKSFGDYLTARAVIRVSREIVRFVPRRADFAVQDWIRATSTGVLTREILGFLRDEMRLIYSVDPRTPEEIKAAMESLIGVVLNDGLPIQINEKLTWREAEGRQRNAETMLWAVANATFRALPLSQSVGMRRLKIDWPDRNSFKDLILRLGTGRSPVGSCFSGIVARNTYAFGVYFGEIDLSDSDLAHSNFSASNFDRASLKNCNLEDTLFIRTNLSYVKFVGANVSNCVFNNSIMTGTNIFGQTKGKLMVNRIALLSFDLSLLHKMNKGQYRSRVEINTRFNSQDEHQLSKAADLIVQELAPSIPVATRKRKDELA